MQLNFLLRKHIYSTSSVMKAFKVLNQIQKKERQPLITLFLGSRASLVFSLECFTKALCCALWHQGEVMIFEMILVRTSEDVARHTGLLQWPAAVLPPHTLLPCCLLLPACPFPCPMQLKSLLGRKLPFFSSPSLQPLINFYQFSKPLE